VLACKNSTLARKPKSMADKIDPFDVAALEKSLNDSATRVSTIWISFLIFSLYLLIATGTTTHRQLLLEEPLKLPALNIDLSLYWFFVLVPVLFTVFHFYVLLQVLLLGRTAAAYNDALDRAVRPPPGNASMRQRLANTLFAQIFAGSPRERDGWLGRLLKTMAWITLAFTPIYVLLAFQFVFLPYHDAFATWVHRLLLFVELAIAFVLWPLVLDARRDFSLRRLRMRIGLSARVAFRLFAARKWRKGTLCRRMREAGALVSCISLIAISLSLLSFPGELHVNLFALQSPSSVDCERIFHRTFGRLDLRFERLKLARVDIVDDEKFDKIEKATERAREKPYQGERTRLLRDRDLNCGDFSDFADLRRIDLTGAQLKAANFRRAKLQGTSLVGAWLQEADLSEAQLQGASLDGARLQRAYLVATQLQGATLKNAELQGAFPLGIQLQGATLDDALLPGLRLEGAQLQGASLRDAQLQGAELRGAQLQGASLWRARLQGASLQHAQLQGASLNDAKLQGANLGQANLLGASLDRAELQGVSLDRARLQGASLRESRLQGASLRGANLQQSVWSGAQVWRTRDVDCRGARIVGLKFEAVELGKEIDRAFAEWAPGFPHASLRQEVSKKMRERLTAEPGEDETTATENAWRGCANESSRISQRDFDTQHLALLRGLVCEVEENGAAVGVSIFWNWTSGEDDRLEFSTNLARALLGENGQTCAAANDYDAIARKWLRYWAGPPPPPPK
jgi:uncharacterized protein YjbI with pentapeptide repeats